MAKQDLSRHQEKIVKRYYEHHETIQNNKLGELLSELWLTEDETLKTRLWGKAQVALMRLEVDAQLVANICGERDVNKLGELISDIDAGKDPSKIGQRGSGTGHHKDRDPNESRFKSLADGRTLKQARQEAMAKSGNDSLEEPNLKHALKQFRRKLKSMRRDDESRLGGRYVSQGKSSAIDAIQPPDEFPAAVWDKLVATGRLKKVGKGMYQLP